MTHQIGLSVLDGVGYGLDSMGRRISITRPGGQNDSYGYDAAGQVTAGSYLATPSGNQSDGFAYDAMGNRTTSARNGVNVSYSANALEQYSTVGGAVPSYDAGGNALSLPVPGAATVEMSWDAENRMLSSTRNGAAVGATVLPLSSSLVNGARVVNRYDVLHRRVVKEVHAPNGSGGWTLQERRLFTYDGWNVIEERAFDAGGSLVAWQRLTWGRDASGSLQGAGGVGGLLLAEELPVSGVGSAVGHYPGYDGNGNVVLMTTGSGVVEGRWRYGAFGGTLGSVTASGGYAERQAWRFSGKYLDGEVETRGGVYYYGFRHYVPEVGRWASRDPIGERGGVNLYGMVGNGAVNAWDYLGLDEREVVLNMRTKQVVGGPTGSAIEPATIEGNKQRVAILEYKCDKSGRYPRLRVTGVRWKDGGAKEPGIGFSASIFGFEGGDKLDFDVGDMYPSNGGKCQNADVTVTWTATISLEIGVPFGDYFQVPGKEFKDEETASKEVKLECCCP